MSSIAMEIIPEGTCPLCKRPTDSEIVAIDVSCWGYAARRFGCLDCKDRVTIAVRRVLESVGFSEPAIVRKRTDHFTIHCTQTHSCGQVYEQILHLKHDDAFLLKLGMAVFPYATDLTLPFTLPDMPLEKTVQVEGHVEQIELTGVDWKKYSLVCQKCGADMLFPSKEQPAS